MNKSEKKVLINAILKSLKNSVLEKVDKMPDNWDGIEIRQFISDHFKQEYVFKKMDAGRLKDYYNDCLVNDI